MKQQPAASLTGFGDSALETLLGEAVALFHRLQAVAERVYRQGGLSAGRRGVLRGLQRGGPQTVPQMARARPASRQYIQTLVNSLSKDGYVELVANPAHKRSRLVQLTPEGKDLVENMARREARLLADLPVSIEGKDLQEAAAVLRRVREFFESDLWESRLENQAEASRPRRNRS